MKVCVTANLSNCSFKCQKVFKSFYIMSVGYHCASI